ncbi:hypothetical protein [Legionella spiritensis]|uniref:Uncharacterized protein n=1 Tax=Legionella spiritensis TaxID=452 RepID=A0A0W0Z5D1_LEGSP|nr:hypothetical protein [Legionella spiritensis]KTD64361.1 hypothetical protein Lspi_1168 [Legionella spiritensis]SNV46322.1 Uncharacterised protein [Legionella spiritensis]
MLTRLGIWTQLKHDKIEKKFHKSKRHYSKNASHTTVEHRLKSQDYKLDKSSVSIESMVLQSDIEPSKYNVPDRHLNGDTTHYVSSEYTLIVCNKKKNNLLMTTSELNSFIRNSVISNGTKIYFNRSKEVVNAQKNKPHILDIPREFSSELKQVSILLSRLAMNQPRAANTLILKYLHQSIGITFQRFNDDAIEWLLGGTNGMEVGGFDSAQDFRNFFNKKADRISPDDLATAIESVLTAMGYRMINAPWAMAPQDPQNDPNATKDQKEIHQFIQHIKTLCFIPKPINDVYKNRRDDLNPQSNEEIIIPKSRIDHANHDCGRAKVHKVTPRNSLFRMFCNQQKPTWAKQCEDKGIPIINHVSGSAPLTLSALDALLRFQMGDDFEGIINEEARLLLYGPLLLATYERGNYHSLSETVCGMLHYLAETKTRDSSTEQCPVEAYIRGINVLASSCDKSIREPLLEIVDKLQQQLEQHRQQPR